MKFFIYTCFFGALLMSACEEAFELEVDIPEEMVIDSRIQAGKSPEVVVSVVDERGQLLVSDLLQQSNVTIQAEDSPATGLKLVSSSETSATYSSDIVIQAGTRYTLLIQSPGLSDVRSITDVPLNVSVRKGSGGAIGPKGGILPEGDFFYLPIAFDDHADEDNYYHIVVTVQNANDETEIQAENIMSFGISPMPQSARRFNETGWLFSDKDFRDGIFEARLRILEKDVRQFYDPVATVELRTVSVDYFNYHIQSSRPKSSGLPNHGQVGTIDNVSGGGGLFGGFSSALSNYLLEF